VNSGKYRKEGRSKTLCSKVTECHATRKGPKDDNCCELGRVGDIWVRPSLLFWGYWRGLQETQAQREERGNWRRGAVPDAFTMLYLGALDGGVKADLFHKGFWWDQREGKGRKTLGERFPYMTVPLFKSPGEARRDQKGGEGGKR